VTMKLTPTMNANDVKTYFEAAAAEWDTMRLTYYDERVIDTIADAIVLDDTQTVLDVAEAWAGHSGSLKLVA
jgi:hypothetical protein